MEIVKTKTAQIWHQGRPQVQVTIRAKLGIHDISVTGISDSYAMSLANAQARLQTAVNALQMEFPFPDELEGTAVAE